MTRRHDTGISTYTKNCSHGKTPGFNELRDVDIARHNVMRSTVWYVFSLDMRFGCMADTDALSPLHSEQVSVAVCFDAPAHYIGKEAA